MKIQNRLICTVEFDEGLGVGMLWVESKLGLALTLRLPHPSCAACLTMLRRIDLLR